MTKYVYFVRHGQSMANACGVHQGMSGELSEQGGKEARAVAGRFAHIPVQVVVASSYQRAMETADIIATRLGIEKEPNDLAVEWLCYPSCTVGKHYHDESAQRVVEEWRNHAKASSVRYADEETFPEAKERVFRLLKDMEMRNEGHIVVVTHARILRIIYGLINFGLYEYTVGRFLALLSEKQTRNTGVTTISYDPDRLKTSELSRWRVVSWDDCSHLEGVQTPA